ncbi:MAG: ABC transporter permease [Oscillospiraceae bacterium]|nr:ABC transporter permease [Oscillospiraceae bacterium]
MKTALQQALELIIGGSGELSNILLVTARVSLTSSLVSLIIGVPIGLLLGSKSFFGRRALVVISRTLMGMPPVVCGLLFYMLFSGVGPFGRYKLLFTVEIMILAQVVLIIPLVVSNMETYVSRISDQVRETARGLGLKGLRVYVLLANESVYQIFTTYLLAFARAVAEVGAVSMVGGAIAWKTNVMTTAIMLYTNRGSFTLGVALGLILMTISLAVNILVTLLQRRLSR